MFKFANPGCLYLFALFLLLVGVYVYMEIRRKRQLAKFGNSEAVKLLMPSRSLVRQRLKYVMVFVSLASLILVVSRLQYSGSVMNANSKRNVEVVAVVDVSNSMLCSDVAPSRLDRAKALLVNLLEKSDNSKFGLVEFAGLAVTKMPLTGDYSSAKMFVNSMSTADVSTQGTAIGMALVQASRSFSKDENVGHSIILITDAENHEDDAVATAKDLAKKGIKITVVGIGSPQGALLQIADTVLKDQNGAPVITKLDENTAGEIAKATNSSYIRYSNTEDCVKEINSDLEGNSYSKDSNGTNQIFTDQFQTFALVAFLFLFVHNLLMERKNNLLENLNLKDKINGFRKNEKYEK